MKRVESPWSGFLSRIFDAADPRTKMWHFWFIFVFACIYRPICLLTVLFSLYACLLSLCANLGSKTRIFNVKSEKNAFLNFLTKQDFIVKYHTAIITLHVKVQMLTRTWSVRSLEMLKWIAAEGRASKKQLWCIPYSSLACVKSVKLLRTFFAISPWAAQEAHRVFRP